MSKKITLKNKDIAPIYNVLDALKVEGFKVKRGKGKLQNNLKKKLEEYQKDLEVIQENYFQKDEKDNFRTEGQNLVWLDDYREDPHAQKEAENAIKELAEENAVISLVEYETKIKTFLEALEEDKFSANESLKDDDFELMVDMLEKTFKKEKENE